MHKHWISREQARLLQLAKSGWAAIQYTKNACFQYELDCNYHLDIEHKYSQYETMDVSYVQLLLELPYPQRVIACKILKVLLHKRIRIFWFQLLWLLVYEIPIWTSGRISSLRLSFRIQRKQRQRSFKEAPSDSTVVTESKLLYGSKWERVVGNGLNPSVGRGWGGCPKKKIPLSPPA